MSEKTMSHAEALAQLEQRRSGPRRAVSAGTAHAATIRRVSGHKFRVGQTVTLLPNRYGANRLGRFEVTFLLPQEHGIHQYRLKSVTDGHQRVATEDELN